MTLQNPTEYCPTPKVEILLEVLINPEYRMKSVTEICRIAAHKTSGYIRRYLGVKCKQNATDTGNERNLTKAEQSILETMLNPENRMKSVTDILECYLAEQTKLYKI